jgi:hypothetical protein
MQNKNNKKVKKLKNKLIILSGFLAISLMVFSSVSVNAVVDGNVGTIAVYDQPIISGTVTKDIPYTSDIFKGNYGVSSTYTLADFSLASGEIYDYSSTATYPGYGNISFNPAEATHTSYNSSGLLDFDDWTEVDTGSSLTVYEAADTGSVVNAPPSMRMYGSSTGTATAAYIHQLLANPISDSKYFVFGAYIGQESLNITTSFILRLYDAAGNRIAIKLSEAATDWTSGGAGSEETISFDDDPGDVIFMCAQLSEIDNWDATFAHGSITEIRLYIADGSSAWEGTISIDIFALGFVDTVVKAGLDKGDQASIANDYVVMNVTDPSDADLNVREIDSAIGHINNADIDFIYTPAYEDATYTSSTKTANFEYEIMVDTETDWVDEVTFGTMTLYFTMGTDATAYSVFTYGGTDRSDDLNNEEQGDAITLGTVVEDTVYIFEFTRTYTTDEWADVQPGITDWLANLWTNTVTVVTSQNFLIIGGVSLVLIIGFAVWYTQFKKKKKN